jgi:HEAT repeat protein
VRPAGMRVDWAFAELASAEARTRLGAAQTIGRLALDDGRAIPALTDRLEKDPSPYVRRVVAARVLSAVTGDERVRAALETAAANSDGEVRWAAGYAPRRLAVATI